MPRAPNCIRSCRLCQYGCDKNIMLRNSGLILASASFAMLNHQAQESLASHGPRFSERRCNRRARRQSIVDRLDELAIAMTDKPTIVLADDNAGIMEVLAKLLRPCFRIVAQCKDGDAAFKAIKEFSPRLGILDIAMPRSTG